MRILLLALAICVGMLGISSQALAKDSRAAKQQGIIDFICGGKQEIYRTVGSSGLDQPTIWADVVDCERTVHSGSRSYFFWYRKDVRAAETAPGPLPAEDALPQAWVKIALELSVFVIDESRESPGVLDMRPKAHIADTREERIGVPFPWSDGPVGHAPTFAVTTGTWHGEERLYDEEHYIGLEHAAYWKNAFAAALALSSE